MNKRQEHPGNEQTPHSVRHEVRDVRIQNIVLFGVVFFIIVAVAFLVVDWMFSYMAAHQELGPPLSPLAKTQPRPPQPRLQVVPWQELQKLRATEDAALNSYGWMDQRAGTVRIPVDRAIELLSQKGLPVREPAAKKK